MRLNINCCYMHIGSLNTYKILMITNDKATKNQSFVPTVVYEDRRGDLWSRPVSEFLEKFKAI